MVRSIWHSHARKKPSLLIAVEHAHISQRKQRRNALLFQMMVQKALSAKSLSDAQGATILTGWIKVLPLFLIVIPGMISRVMYKDEVRGQTVSSRTLTISDSGFNLYFEFLGWLRRPCDLWSCLPKPRELLQHRVSPTCSRHHAGRS